MLTYKGEGYSPAFVANFSNAMQRISAGEPIEVIEGPDDICACLMQEKSDAHCLNDSVIKRDMQALRDLAKEGFNIKQPFKLNAVQLTDLRKAFTGSRIRGACEGCEWHGLCTNIAKNGFQDVSLKL